MLKNQANSDLDENGNHYLNTRGNNPVIFKHWSNDMSLLNDMIFSTKLFFKPETAPYYDPKKDRKVALVTGGSSGIGWYTCLHLYLHGYIVYLAARNEKKMIQAIDDIKEETVKRTEDYSHDEKGTRQLGELHYFKLDLCDLSSVPKVIEEFGIREYKLDVLINNAGLMGVPFEMTKDGYEIQYQVNFVGHMLLTLKLLPFLNRAESTPRIINLSSIGHNFQFRYFPPEEHELDRFPNPIYCWVRYGIAKTSQIQFAKRLATKYPNILSLAVHPGIAFGTELYDYWTAISPLRIATRIAFAVSDIVIGISNEEGSYATLRAAMDPDLTPEEHNGTYLCTGGSFGVPSRIATDEDCIDATWNWNIDELNKRGFKICDGDNSEDYDSIDCVVKLT